MAELDRSNNDSDAGAVPAKSDPLLAADRPLPAADVPLNAIDITERPRKTPAGGTVRVDAKRERADRGKKDNQTSERSQAKPSLLAGRSEAIPDAVRERFIQIGNHFFFPDGAEAFTDHGNRVTTRSENAVVVQSMVAIAQVRAATSVTVSGTDFFKKEAWFAASLAGLEVRGYEPSALEQERLVRAIARRRTAAEPESSSVTAQLEGRKAESASRGAPASGQEPTPKDGELIVGLLAEHGPAPYQHQPKQPMSYYARIETEHGDREIWGVDLERAFRHSLSTPGVGDAVGLRAIGRDRVTVSAPKYDAAGQEIGREAVATHRNQWIIERRDFLDRRGQMADLFRDATVNAAEAVKQYPELEGSYLQLQMARAGAEERSMSSDARGQFVDHVRAHLAKAIEYGQALEPVHLRARPVIAPDLTAQKIPERDHAPAR
jgi:hypothetical protein